MQAAAVGIFPDTGRLVPCQVCGREEDSKAVFFSRPGEKPTPEEMKDPGVRKHQCWEKWMGAGVCFRKYE